MSTAHVSIAGRNTAVLFSVIAHRPRELIIGPNFLSAHSALLHCSASTLHLELSILSATYDVTPSRFSHTKLIRLPPKSLSYTELPSSPPVPDCDYIFSLLTDIPLRCDVAVFYTFLTMMVKSTSIPVVGFSLSKQIVPQLICIAQLQLLGDHHAADFSLDASSEPTSFLNTVSSAHPKVYYCDTSFTSTSQRPPPCFVFLQACP